MTELIALAFAQVAVATSPATHTVQADAALRQQIERTIQSCIREKAASAYVCRASAYATALSQGYSPERAAGLTGYKRK